MPIASAMAGAESTCTSDGDSPKINVPASTVPASTVGDQSFEPCAWSQSFGAATSMVYAPSTVPYGCPPGAVWVVPFPCMMNQNGQVVQFPCPMDQSGQAVWAPPSYLMHSESDSWPSYNEGSQSESSAGREETISAAPCNEAPCMAADIDPVSRAPKVGTWFKKLPAVFEEASEEPGASRDTYPEDEEDVAALGNPRQMLVDTELAAHVEEQLESVKSGKRAALIAWMRPAVIDLALSANGTRVIQKALEVTGGDSQVALSRCLHGHVRHLLDSFHGNHVLQASIVMMPPHAFQFILQELSFFAGGWTGVIKHRFGCRVVERLLEHCESAESTAPIVAAVVADIESHAKHPFANYVVQHILEYVPAHRNQVVRALIQVGVPQLAQHRVASNTIERAFEHGDAESQRALAEAILSTPNAIVEMGSSRYGSFSVRRMLEALQDPQYCIALQQLQIAIPTLRASKHGRHIAARVAAALSKMGARW